MTPYTAAVENDIISGGTENDFLYGDSGDDTLHGDAGDDHIYGNDGTDNVYGDAGNDWLSGGSGNDFLYGGTENDTLYGDSGNDQMFGENGNDTLYGSYGVDTMHGNAGTDTLYGGNQNDILYGDSENDWLYGEAGNDTVYGNTGDDQIYGGTDNDTLYGNENNDYIEGNEGDDQIFGNIGNDTIYGNDGNDYIEGNEDNDEIHGGFGTDLIHGNTGSDNIFGDGDSDTIYGDENDDTIHGGDAADRLYGNDGIDTIYGDAGDDYIEGNAGNDILSGNTGRDVIYGNDGDDTIHGNEDEDVIYGNLGNDQLYGDDGSDQIYGNDGDDTLHGGNAVDFLYGNSGNDTLYGDDGNDQLDGGTGVDTLLGGLGDDLIYGGGGVGDMLYGDEGNDRIYGSDEGGEDPNFNDAIRFGDYIDGGSGNDQIWGLGGADDITGNSGNDIIDGGANSDRIYGGDGLDTIYGGIGNDLIYGEAGNDHIYGQQGNDTLSGDAGDDVLDGGTGTDTITGGDGNDELHGGGGVGDNLDGGAGDDILYGSDDGADVLSGGDGRDRLYGNGGNDILMGSAGDDILDGGAGDDTLSGDAGSDVLIGGANHDVLYGQNSTDTGEDNAVDYLYGDFGTNANEVGSGRDRLFGQGGNDLLFGEGDDDFIDAGTGGSNIVDYGAGESGVPSDFVPPSPTPAPPLSAIDIDRAIAALPTGVDYTGRWTEYKLSATGLGISGDAGLSIEPTIAADSTGGQYVAWADSRNGNFEIYLLRHNGGAWQELAGSAHDGGISATLGESRRPTIAFDATGAPIVAWTEITGSGSNIYVARYNSSANGGLGAWEALGTSLNSGGISGTGAADNAQIVLSSAGPVVAWLDSSSGTTQVYVKQFTGGSWQTMGAGSASGGGVSNSVTSLSDLALATDGAKVAIAWSQTVGGSREIYLREYSGGAWNQLAGSASGNGLSNSNGDSQSPTVAYNGGSLFVAWSDNTNGRYNIYAMRYNGASWVSAGTGANALGGVSNTSSQSLQPKLVSGGGRLYLAWTENHVTPTVPNDTDPPPPLSALYVKRWNGTAFAEELPGDATYQGISPSGGVLQANSLAVDAAGHPFVAWQDARQGTPEIYVRGNTFDIGTVYYVNDGATAGDQFSTAIGATGNTGLSPSSPKATIQQVLDTRNLNPGDVILVDTGTYSSTVTIGADDAGALILGAGGRSAVIQGLVTVNVANVILQRLDLSGGVTVVSASSFSAFDDRIAGPGLVLNNASNAVVAHNTLQASLTNVTISGDASGIRLEDLQILSGSKGIDLLATTAATPIVIRANHINTSSVGINLSSSAPASIVDNDIQIGSSGTGLVIAAPFSGTIANNAIHGGSVGISYSASAALSANRIYGNTTGVVSTVAGTINGFGFVGITQPNEIFSNVTGVQLTGQMQNQYIHDNATGVSGSGILGGNDLEHANLIEANTTGVSFTGPIQFNRISLNTIGIVAANAQLIDHNLIYRNTQTALKIQGRNDVRVFQNTFYTPTGDNIRIDGASSQVEIRNNILWAESGYDIYVANDSTSGFFSDYNDLHASGTGKLVYWTRDFTDILDWQEDVHEYDLNSIGYTVVNPLWSEPRFVNRGQDDYRIFDPVSRLRFTSPTIDAGDPRSDQGLPPYYNNLLTNPGFESGLTGWSATPSGGTRTSSPAPWEGSSYFFPQSNAVTSVEQTVDLLAKGYTAAQIDNSNLMAVFGGRVRSQAETPADQGELTLIYLDGSSAILKQITVKAENVSDRWELIGTRQPIPAGTRFIKIRFTAVQQTGGENNSYLDSAFLYVQSNSEAPNIGAYGNTTHELTQNLNQHLVLRTPDLYKDWERDKPILIRWDSFGNISNAPIKIDLYQDGPNGPQFVSTIATNAPDTGEYSWIAGNSGVNFGTYGLRIQISLVGNATVMDRSTETFTVPENTNTFYVNDKSLTNDEYTTAIGSNRNTGKLPDRPKPYPNNVLRIYSIGPTQTLYVDTGDYPLLYPLLVSNVVGLGDDEGFTLTGPTNTSRVALFHHANPFTVAPILELIDADFLTVSHLTLDHGQYGLWAHNSSTNLALSYITSTNNTYEGFRVEGSSDALVFDHLTASYNGRYGIYVDGPINAIRNSLVTHNTNTGIYLNNPGNVAVEGNESANNTGYGIYVYNSVGGTTSIIGNPELTQAAGNKVHDNTNNGIYAYGTIQVAGNTVYNHLGVNNIGINLQGSAQANAQCRAR